MNYQFDQVVNREETNAIKYDYIKRPKFEQDTIPMWVADMDFPAPPEVLEDIQKAVTHGIFGYSMPGEAYDQAVIEWYKRRHGYQVERNEIVNTPGVVYALAQLVQAFTEQGDAILIQTPVYHPFQEVIRANHRVVVSNPLHFDDHKYTIDFDDFEEKIKTHNVKMFLLCNPHNPVGRVWKRDELERLNEICVTYDVLIVSDEIHCDFIYEGHQHYSFAHINSEAIITTAPSKTFNLAGLQVAHVFLKNQERKRKLEKQIEASGYSQLNTLGLVACQSAYEKGEAWLTELLLYLADNVKLVRDFVETELPMVKLIEPEGTYLLWLDFSEYDQHQEEIEDRMVHGAKLFLSTGTTYGVEGVGFMRMNIACPRVILEEALRRIKREFTKKVEWIHLDTFQSYGD